MIKEKTSEKLCTASEIKGKLPETRPPIICYTVMTMFKMMEKSKFFPVNVGWSWLWF